MLSYHGTSSVAAAVLAAGTVDVSLGGGELGQGFYTGTYLYEAKAWAFQIHGDMRDNVVEFNTPDTDVEVLDILLLDHGTASLRRHGIRQLGLTRVHKFGVDMVWAPVVGTERVTGDQYKWESDVSQSLLNGVVTRRRVT